MTNQIPPTCETCGAPVKFVPAGISRKTNKPYKEFYSCSQRCGWTWRPDQKQIKSGVEAENSKDVILIEKLDEINKRLDALGIYLKSKLGE